MKDNAKEMHFKKELKKFTNNNIKKAIPLVKTYIYIALVVIIIGIIYISSIIYYLNSLTKCDCFKQSNTGNLTYLIGIESVILALHIIYAIILCLSLNFVNKMSKKGGSVDKTVLYITFLICLLIYGFFIFYVYKLYENIDPNCECTENWIRYLLYMQAFYMLFVLIGQFTQIAIK